eukprot:COSAG02_NODE_45876_length_353_cov_1.011811_1_plen_91_part_01
MRRAVESALRPCIAPADADEDAPPPLSPLAVASAISHIALALILLDTRVELSGVRENAPASHRSLLGDAHAPELRKEMELINARFEGLQSA